MHKKGMNAKISSYHSPYKILVIMVLFNFLAMFVLMYSMIDGFSNFFPNLNQFYMALLMVSSMTIIELALMNMMYPNKKKNIIIIFVAILLLAISFIFIRQQIGISDAQFLRSMIPHHAGAILMCEKADIKNPEIKDLCRSIISSQQSEIDKMKGILQKIEG